MELDGLKLCIDELRRKGLSIASLTTDRHPAVEAHMRKEEPTVVHYFDTWHVVKGRQNVYMIEDVTESNQMRSFLFICISRQRQTTLHLFVSLDVCT